MRRTSAFLGSAMWLVVAPGLVAGLVPWLLTDWHGGQVGALWMPARLVGVVLIVAGTAVLLHAFGRFVREGLGTPAPVAPPEHLVVGGLYRRVRNPMYLAVVGIVVGQALVLARPGLLWYTAALAGACAGFVLLYEEPHLRERFGTEYDDYCRAVRRWWPHVRPAGRSPAASEARR